MASTGEPRREADGKKDGTDVSLVAIARQYSHYATVGIMFPVAIALGFFGGYMLDLLLGTVPLFALVGLCFGVAAAIRNLLQTAASDKNV